MLTPEKKPLVIKRDKEATATTATAAGEKSFSAKDKAKGGRPFKKEEEKGTKNRIAIYLSDAELEAFTEEGNKLGISPSAYIKLAGFEKLKQSK